MAKPINKGGRPAPSSSTKPGRGNTTKTNPRPDKDVDGKAEGQVIKDQYLEG